MAGDQEKGFVGKLKDFLIGNTIASNMLLGTVGFMSMPLMGALIGANTAWKKLSPAKSWTDIAKNAFSVLMGAVSGASVGLLGTAVVGVVGLFGGPVGVVAGMGLTALAASYMGKSSATKQEAALTPHKGPKQEKVHGNSKTREKEKVQNKAPERVPEQVVAEAKAIVKNQGETVAKGTKATPSHGDKPKSLG